MFHFFLIVLLLLLLLLVLLFFFFCSEELPPLTGAPPSTKSHSAPRSGGEVGLGDPYFGASNVYWLVCSCVFWLEAVRRLRSYLSFSFFPMIFLIRPQRDRS